MSAIEALVLGIIQGLTEFLPVSSSGHLELGALLLNIKPGNNLLFAIIVHGATALSTIVVFRNTIWQLIKSLFQFKLNEDTKLIIQIVISMIPVGVVGLFFEKEIESFFSGNVVLVASMLGITGILLLLTYYAKNTTKELSYTKAFIIGIAQAIAIMPGISRSGATISTALLLGVNREKAAKFSFLMVLPPILGATLLKVKDYFEAPSATDNSLAILPMILGFLAAFISGLLACTWMINLVKRGKLIYFAIYCILISIIALSVTLF
ncbi:undecaprenyl-diphosphatase UppP [Fulvivirga lutea]|uniref:Undecaprenyl-diphosphatase n=1 Tax=Fulvivirga lutea TaxID=2810512 RepID=A0A974WF72_9BACT|nr:undecaprenyl-diphosphatase UppP [Fulvivirga lutea]QSE96855.1 undecaprenyl-diphosphatase UppP [Fulvivirga lutea]